MGSSKKTITDLQIVDLLEAGTAEAEGRRNAILRCQGDGTKYASLYTAFKKDYRKKYSSKFLQGIGYDPHTTAQTRVLSKATVKTYLLGKGLTVDTILQLRTGYLEKYATAKHWLQTNYGLNNTTEQLVYSGKTYGSLLVTNGGSTITITMMQYYVEAFQQWLAQYGYDGTFVWRPTGVSTITKSGTAGASTTLVEMKVYNGAVLVDSKSADTSVVKTWSLTSISIANGSYTVKLYANGVETSSETVVVDNMQKYSVDTFTPTVYDVGGITYYRVNTVLTISPYTVVVEDVPINYFIRTMQEYAYEVMYVTYNVVSGGESWFSYVEDLDTVPTNLYTTATINMTAILPMKEDNVIYDATEIRRKRLLRKLGLQPTDLVDSLKDTNLDNAYLWTGLPISNADQGSIKVMFKTFDYIANGSGNMTISISRLSMSYNFTITKTTHTGSVLPVGTYSKVLTGSDTEDSEGGGTFSTLTLRYQGSATEWREIVVTNYMNTYTISGRQFTGYLTSNKDTARLIIPLDVLNGLKYREYVTVFESSLSLLCYSITVVKVKWYQSSFFGFLLKIIAVVVAIYTWGAGSEVSEGIWAVAESIGTMVLKAVIIQVAITTLMNALGPEMGALVAILAIMATAYTGNFGMSLDGFKGWLATASNILKTMDQALVMKMQELMVKSKAELEEIADKTENLEKVMEEMRSFGNDMTYMINSFNDTVAYSSPNGVVSPDQYIAAMQGAIAYNYDVLYDVDGAITKRKVVNSG